MQFVKIILERAYFNAGQCISNFIQTEFSVIELVLASIDTKL
ncbi:MAG TPA: hypothetical protein VGY31_15680 [Terriglobia bacterium]|nr:hypothetical protein [Terriglobia bacterium]